MAIEIKPEEISEVLRKQITDFEKKIDVSEIGVVTFVGDGVAKIYGMDNAMYSELLDFPNNVVGMVLNLEEDAVSAV
ncbi:MAG: F0F1 ATP synthase subunit alpha, partial [Nitrospirota bacterium]